MPKRPPRENTVTIESLSHEGRGIAKINGKTTFVDGALPGETVLAKHHKRHRQYDEAITLQVLENPNPDRIEAKCEYFGVCGGCRLQHLPMSKQLSLQQQQLLEQLQHAGITPNEVVAPLDASHWGYRRKARIGVKFLAPKDKVVIGFRERDGRFINNSDFCHILHPSIGEKIKDWSKFIYTLSIRDQIPQLEIAVADNASAIIIRHLAPFPEEDLAKLAAFAKQHNYWIYLQSGGPDSIELFSEAGSPSSRGQTPNLLQYKIENITIHFSPEQFTQINSEINEKMITQALSWLALESSDQVLDLFCGIGNFTLPMAQQCEKVIGVEGESKAVERAKQNAQLNQIDNTEFYVANLFEEINSLNWARQTYNKLLLDPPRAGALEVLANLTTWKPETIVYVSCNPATFIRDAKEICQQGYQLDKLGIMNMFPHTGHIEVMGAFTKQ